MKLADKNILFFTCTMGVGGTEKVILQLCRCFKPLVHSITVCSCGGVNEIALQQMGIDHITIPDIRKKTAKTFFTVSNMLKTIIRERKITVIHTHHRMAAFYVSALQLYRKCVFINTSHNTFYDKKWLTYFAYRKAHIVACGEMVKQNLVKTFAIKEQNVHVICNGVEPFNGKIVQNDIIRDLRKQGLFVVANIGRLCEQKGMIYYLSAIPNVIRKYPNTCFLIIGTGEMEDELRTLVSDLKIDQYVYFLGYKKDVQNIMAQVDLIVLSSLWEGFPLTPMEAFSVGKTVIATAVDGTTEIVENGKSGILIQAQNSSQLANSIIWVIEHPNKVKCMERVAKKRFEEKYSDERFSNAYITFYKDIIPRI